MRDPDRPSPRGLAGWQKALGIIGLVVVLLLVIMLAGGRHGPGRHGSSGGQGPSLPVHELSE